MRAGTAWRTFSDPDFLRYDRHLDSLLRTAIGVLRDGDLDAAFALADRYCRLAPESTRGHLTKSLILERLGKKEAAAACLQNARRADGFDMAVARIALRRTADPDLRRGAARAVLSHPLASEADVAEAAQLLLPREGHGCVLTARRRGTVVEGFVFWRGDVEPVIRCDAGSSIRAVELGAPLTAAGEVKQARFSLRADPASALALSAGLDDDLSVVHLYSSESPAWPVGAWSASSAGDGRLNVVIPVYRDPESTRRCLDSLRRQEGGPPLAVTVVDDCSPDPAVTRVASTFCAETGATFLSNPTNLGFTGAVNAAIVRCEAGDVLLLNADVELGDGCLARLARIVRADASIGTAMPLSNDSSATSFPRADRPNPLPTPGETARIDAAARAAHGEAVVDVLTNIGFCLYIREACVRAVGLLSPVFGRGYYEDIDYCLRAAEHGSRNVAVPGIYVSHASGRSFGDAKPMLVRRNHALIQTRFPPYMRLSDAEDEADPLAEARGAIEERLPPERTLRVGVMRREEGWRDGEAATARAWRERQDLHVLWDRAGRETSVRIRGSQGASPQSLRFTLDPGGLERCRAYLSALTVATLDLEDPGEIPFDLTDLLAGLRWPAEAIIGTRAAARAIDDGWAGRRAVRRVVAADSMAAAYLAAPPAGAVPRSGPRRGSVPCRRLGIVAPHRRIESDRLVAALARAFACRGPRSIVVFGNCLDDPAMMQSGIVHVTGPIATRDHAELFAAYGVDAILSPYRTSLFGVFEAATRDASLPRLYFDWSDGAMAGRPGDTALPWDLPDEEVCAAFAAAGRSIGRAGLV